MKNYFLIRILWKLCDGFSDSPSFFLWVDDFPMPPILKVFVNLGCIMKFYRCKCLWYSICAISNCIEKLWKINERVQLRDDFLFVESIFYLYCCKFIMSLYKHTHTHSHIYIYIYIYIYVNCKLHYHHVTIHLNRLFVNWYCLRSVYPFKSIHSGNKSLSNWRF